MRRTSLARFVFALTLLLAWATGAGAALAADAPQLKVSVIHATRAAAPPDPALERLQGELAQAFAGYKGFKRLQAEQLTLDKSRPARIELPSGQAAELHYKGRKKNMYELRLVIPGKVEVDLRAPARKVFYQAGLRHQGGILILAFNFLPE